MQSGFATENPERGTAAPSNRPWLGTLSALLCVLASSCDNGGPADALSGMEPRIVAQTPSNLVLDITGAGRLKLQAASRRILLDGILIHCNTDVQAYRGKWKLAPDDESNVLRPLLLRRTCTDAPSPLIVLDPGHGGTDSGAKVPGKILEKDVTLDISIRIKAAMEAAGYRVRLTRTSDTTLTLPQRSQIAAACKADLFVSVHINASRNTDATGIETFTLPAPGYPSTGNSTVSTAAVPANRFDADSNILAYRVHAAIIRATGMSDRGIRRARFAVLENAPCPAILVECGFATNDSDLQRLTSIESRNEMALAIAKGILEAIPRQPAQQPVEQIGTAPHPAATYPAE